MSLKVASTDRKSVSAVVFAEGGDCSLVEDNSRSNRRPSIIPGGIPTEALPYAEVLEEQWAYFLFAVTEAQRLLTTTSDSMPAATRDRLSDLVARHQSLNSVEQTELGDILVGLRHRKSCSPTPSTNATSTTPVSDSDTSETAHSGNDRSGCTCSPTNCPCSNCRGDQALAINRAFRDGDDWSR